MALFRRRPQRQRVVVPADEAIDTLREHTARWVHGGFMPYEEVLDSALELAADEGIEEVRVRAVVHETWDARLAEQAGWPSRTDSDRLDAAFAALESQDIVARMSFSCCGSCAPGEIAAEVGAPGTKRGYVYFHQQDAESISEGAVYLGYGSLAGHRKGVRYDRAGFQRASLAVAAAAVDALRAEGLTVEWDGALSKRILVTDLDWKRRLAPRPA